MSKKVQKKSEHKLTPIKENEISPTNTHVLLVVVLLWL